jgi:CRISPR-associated endonuclease Cas1
MKLIGYDSLDITKWEAKINTAKNKKSLIGIEGNVASLYWAIIGQYVQGMELNNIKWEGRNKYPCTDPINSLLSLAYSLLSTQCQTTLTLQGLDQYVGILHFTNDLRPALVYDIMEVYRVFLVDIWVLKLFKQKIFVKEDFRKTKEGVCTLQSDKKNEFFKLWFKRLKHLKLSSNNGPITIHDFLYSNTNKLIELFKLLEDNKIRDTGRINRLKENMIIFNNINEFKQINI